MANITSQTENYIRSKVAWEALPASVQQQLGNVAHLVQGSDAKSRIEQVEALYHSSTTLVNAIAANVLADATQGDEDMINHLSDQNEELFNNYRKA